MHRGVQRPPQEPSPSSPPRAALCTLPSPLPTAPSPPVAAGCSVALSQELPATPLLLLALYYSMRENKNARVLMDNLDSEVDWPHTSPYSRRRTRLARLDLRKSLVTPNQLI